MLKSIRRQRRSLTSLILGTWIFTLFVGIANACGWDGVTAPAHDLASMSGMVLPSDDGVPSACAQFCNDDVPLVVKVQQVQDPPGSMPLIVATHYTSVLAPIAGSISRPALTAHPPPDVPVLLRFLHLAL
jgi:hypothetical protein